MRDEGGSATSVAAGVVAGVLVALLISIGGTNLYQSVSGPSNPSAGQGSVSYADQ